MKRYLYLFPLMAFTAATLALGACDDKKEETAAPADQTTVAPETTDSVIPSAPTVVVTDAIAYATAQGGTNGAIFLKLQNTGTETDKLVAATTDAASIVEIHEVATDASGVAQMRKVDGVEIRAGQEATLSPAGYHIMLMGLTAPLAVGQTFNVTLDFDKSADVVVPVTVETAGIPAAGVSETTEPTGGVAPSTDATTTPETVTAPAEGTIPSETTPTDEPITTAPTTDVPTGADPTSLEAPASEDVQEEPTPVQ